MQQKAGWAGFLKERLQTMDRQHHLEGFLTDALQGRDTAICTPAATPCTPAATPVSHDSIFMGRKTDPGEIPPMSRTPKAITPRSDATIPIAFLAFRFICLRSPPCNLLGSFPCSSITPRSTVCGTGPIPSLVFHNSCVPWICLLR